ncbi:hypothetical protein ACP70R_039103 [Stipagrostis hirtigluma subsp. patula]
MGAQADSRRAGGGGRPEAVSASDGAAREVLLFRLLRVVLLFRLLRVARFRTMAGKTRGGPGAGPDAFGGVPGTPLKIAEARLSSSLPGLSQETGAGLFPLSASSRKR